MTNSPGTVAKNFSTLISEVSGATFVLDGRYMRTFNGPGLTQPFGTVYPYNLAAFGNMRVANFDPDSQGMDEDYDACDLENWFLGIQSADGQVVIPSFHRPGILMAADWLATANQQQRAKILRPRQADNSPLFPPDPSNPDPLTGKLTYDIDNDGDGVTDSVWLDLGYPVQRDPLTNKLYKPLFAFMVLGLNGRLPLNTVGNLQARAIGDQLNTSGAGQSGTQSSLATVNGNASDTSQVPYPGVYPTPSATPDSTYFFPQLSSQVYLDSPLWDHASHLGYSVNEINPKYALQNAPSNLYPIVNGVNNGDPYGVYPFYPFQTNTPTGSYSSQYDNLGLSVALTQIRNILAGTVPTDVANPISSSNLTNVGAVDPTTLSSWSLHPTNYDLNVTTVDGNFYVLPNNVADGFDYLPGGASSVARTYVPVAGRWGEVQGVPLHLPFPSLPNPALYSGGGGPVVYATSWYSNPVRAGRSYFNLGTNDTMDDDFDALDPYLPNALENINNTFSLYKDLSSTPNPNTATAYQIPLNLATAYTGSYAFTRVYPECVDLFDTAGQMGIPSERIRRFTTPIDPAATGRVVDFLNRPNNDHDFGKGADSMGRASYFRYFRPAGMPQEIRYPYSNANATFSSGYVTNSGLGQQYLMPVLLPPGYSSNPTPASKPDIHNNRYHGYQSMLTPNSAGSNVTKIDAMAAMPYDWDLNGNMGSGSVPPGYNYTYDASGNPVLGPVNLLAPTINPVGVVNSSWGPNLNPPGPPFVIAYPATVVNGLLGTGFVHPSGTFYSGGGSLNIDEADEMNLYASSQFDQPYGPSDLEWLYRLQDVDGATLSSRLAKLAPVSFMNAADGPTRRRLFSTDSWELNRFAYANDNPTQYAGAAVSANTGIPTTVDHDFSYNSRFLPHASASLEVMNQVVLAPGGTTFNSSYANPIATEFLPNPTLPPSSVNNNIENFPFNSTSGMTSLPLALTPNGSTLFGNASPTAVVSSYTNSNQTNGVINPTVSPMAVQVQTPSLAHGDRKINLNFPLPIANDPAEPIRQKWCRETYQLLKAILPPAAIDTPEELAALSQFVVNIVDFRDTDCTMTRFVNTDLEVTNPLTLSSYSVQVADANTNQNTAGFYPLDPNAGVGMPALDPYLYASPTGVRFAQTPIPAGHFPYDPSLYSPDGWPNNGARRQRQLELADPVPRPAWDGIQPAGAQRGPGLPVRRLGRTRRELHHAADRRAALRRAGQYALQRPQRHDLRHPAQRLGTGHHPRRLRLGPTRPDHRRGLARGQPAQDPGECRESHGHAAAF